MLEECLARPGAIVSVDRQTLVKILQKHLMFQAKFELSSEVMKKTEKNNIIVQIDVLQGLGEEPDKMEPTILLDAALLGWQVDRTIVSQLSDVYPNGRKLVLPFKKTE